MIALISAMLLAQTYFTPAEAQTLFSQANDAYYKDDFSSAQQAYQKLLDHGYGGPAVLFNLGTLQLAEGDLGNAVLNLERARREEHSSDIEANLAVARSRQMDQVVGAQGEEPFLQRLAASTPGSAIAATFLVAWIAGLLCLLALRFVGGSRRTVAAVLGGLSLAVSVPAGFLLAAHVYVEQTVREAVVIKKMLPARELPRESAKTSFEVHAGLKVRVLEDSGNFVRIRLPNGLEGWTERDGVSVI